MANGCGVWGARGRRQPAYSTGARRSDELAGVSAASQRPTAAASSLRIGQARAAGPERRHFGLQLHGGLIPSFVQPDSARAVTTLSFWRVVTK